MKKWFKKLKRTWLIIKNWLWGISIPLETVFVDESPEALKSDCVYLIGENGFLWSAALLCPCGCNSVIQLNLLPDAKPSWRVEEHEDYTITLTPSVWSRKGCGSHYFIRKGFIHWCRDN